VTVGSETLRIRAPQVNDKRVDPETGARKRFSSRILPAYASRSPKETDVLPILYLRGLSTGDFGTALRDLLGEDAAGLSANSGSATAASKRSTAGSGQSATAPHGFHSPDAPDRAGLPLDRAHPASTRGATRASQPALHCRQGSYAEMGFHLSAVALGSVPRGALGIGRLPRLLRRLAELVRG
jgi:hypothetical protein